MTSFPSGLLSVAPLFVPGHVEKLRDNALRFDDAILIDLEDAVPLERKADARHGATELAKARPGKCFVRVNSLDQDESTCGLAADDIRAVVQPDLAGLVIPKVEDAAMLASVHSAICEAERTAGMSSGLLPLIVTIESARAVMRLAEITAVPSARPIMLAFGMGDFTNDLDISWTRDEGETAVARAMVPIASRAARLPKPLDSVFTDVEDDEGLKQSALRGKCMGYGGKPAIHPRQIPIIRSVYSPGEAEISWASRIVDEARHHEQRGSGAFLLDGRMIDAPIVAQARRILSDAPKSGSRQAT